MTLEKLPYDVGELIADRYVVFSVLERSPQSGSYQARDMKSRNWVVVKVLFKTVGAGDARRFERDMKAVVALDDPHIVPTLDAGVLPNGHRYVCYEQLDGDTLATALKTGPMEPDKVLNTMLQVARGLRTAHQAGVVHGGLTPRNIVLAREGIGRRARVTDFGLAEHASSSGGQLTPGPGDSISGSVRHRAPELISGATPSEASDLYAWGLVYLECLTGNPVLSGANLSEVRKSQSALDPVTIAPVLEGRPETRVLERVLHKRRSKRFSSASDLLEALGVDPAEDAPSSSLPQRVRFDTRSGRTSISGQEEEKSPEEEVADILDIDDFDSLGESLWGSEALSFEVEDSALIAPDPELVTYDGYDSGEFEALEDLDEDLLSEDNPLAELELAPEPLDEPEAPDLEEVAASDEPLTWNLAQEAPVNDPAAKPAPPTSGDVGMETLRKMFVLEPQDEDEFTPLRGSRIPQTIGIAVLALILVGMVAAIIVLGIRKTQRPPDTEGEEVASAETVPPTARETNNHNSPPDPGEEGTSEAAGEASKESDDADANGEDEMAFDFAAEDTLTCEDGDAYACWQRGVDELSIPWPERDETKAAADFQMACDGDEALCAGLGLLYLDGRGGLKQDEQMAYELIKKACIASNQDACVLQGQLIIEGRGTNQDYDKGIALLEPACENDLFAACTTLAEMMDRGRGKYDRNLTAAAELLTRACDGGDGRACGLLAEKHRKGRGVDRDKEKRIELLHKSCELGGGETGCYELGDAYRRGRGGVEKDSHTSGEFYKKGCSRGYPRSCDNACYMLQSGEISGTSTQDAIPWCEAGCNLGYQKACYRGGRFADKLEQDDVAKRLYQRGCDLGHRKSCRRADDYD